MQRSVPDWNLWKVAIKGGINGLARSGRLLGEVCLWKMVLAGMISIGFDMFNINV